MKKTYIQPQAKEIKVELQPIMDASVSISIDGGNTSEIGNSGNDVKEEFNDFGW